MKETNKENPLIQFREGGKKKKKNYVSDGFADTNKKRNEAHCSLSLQLPLANTARIINSPADKDCQNLLTHHALHLPMVLWKT